MVLAKQLVCGVAGVFSVLSIGTVDADVKIRHKPVKQAPSNHRIELQSRVSNSNGDIVDVRAYFKSAIEERFFYVPMNESDSGYVGVLPAPALGVGSIDYMIYAVGSDRQFVKTKRFKVAIKDDEDALQRMTQKEPTDVEINFDRLEQLRDLAERGGQPDIKQRVDVRTEQAAEAHLKEIPGFDDYIALGSGVPAAAGAGLSAATTVASSGGISATAVIGGVAGAAVLSSVSTTTYEDDIGGGGGTTTTPSASLAGSWGDGRVSLTIDSISSSSWSGYISPGDCGVGLNANGSRSGTRLTSSLTNVVGSGFFTGTLSSSGTSMSYTLSYSVPSCRDFRETGTLTRRNRT